MVRGIYPGSFDPVTYGHLDIVERSCRLADELIIGVLHNKEKAPLFTAEERVRMLEQLTSHLPNVKVQAFQGLLVDFTKQCEAQIVIRGLRAITDFDYELQMAQTNRIMDGSVDTIFLTTSLEYAYLSSTTVKEVAYFGGEISKFVPDLVREQIEVKMKEKRSITDEQQN